MKFRHLLLSFAALMMLAGCATKSVNSIRDYKAVDSGFKSLLAEKYRDLAVFEHDKMFDMVDANYFAQKAIAASQGQDVRPSDVSERELPDFAVVELNTAHRLLMDSLKNPEYRAKPETLADAQTKFDCWLEQQEENFQPDHIAACKIEFYQSMRQLTGKKISVVHDTVPVYFDHDSAELDDEAINVIHQVVERLRANPRMMVLLAGNTDTTGSHAYNKLLSERRAVAVKSALMQNGLPADHLRVVGNGEDNLMIKTADNVRERKNRRVDIMISEKVE